MRKSEGRHKAATVGGSPAKAAPAGQAPSPHERQKKGGTTQIQAPIGVPQSGTGAGFSEASAERGRRRDSAPAAGAGLEAAHCRGGAGESGAVGYAKVWGF